jgi:hypothetical protein
MSFNRLAVKWWESRRLRYNGYVCLSIIVCLIIMYLLALIFKHPIYFFFLIPFIVAHVCFLNLAYTFSWILYEFAPFTKKENNNRIYCYKSLLLITFLLNIIISFWLLTLLKVI